MSDCDDYMSWKQDMFDSPMPWIGMYIAAASLVCSIAMAGDVIYGIRHKKLWFPCKFFTMNAASLTLLAVATKLPVDLTTAMWGRTDRVAKLSSTIFGITVMGNFLTSFASMDNNASLVNVVALGILVVTIIVNACIQMDTSSIDYSIWAEEIFVISSMLFLFVTLSFSVLTVPTTKRSLELKYDELHKTISNGGKLEETEKLINQKLKEVVEKYWVMAETSSPQFVMARSVTCATSGIICLLTALTLVEAEIRMNLLYWKLWASTDSNYRWSASWILWIQVCGVAVGTVAPAFRWFTAISFNCRNPYSSNHQNKLKLVEDYRIQRLIEWKEKPLSLQIRSMKCRKLVEGTKNLALDLCIGVQYGIVVASKLVLFISTIFTLPFFSCCYYSKRLNMNLISSFSASCYHESSEPETSELDLSDYVLQLEDEVKFPKRILKNLAREVNQVIQMGRSQKPKHLIELLRKSNDSFEGVAGFDSSQAQNCWTLPVVTLTSIAIALPNTEIRTVERLIRSVSEGLSYARLVEKSLSTRGNDLLGIKHAVDVTWGGIELHGKWLDKDFRKLSLEGKTTKEILQTLADIAEKATIELQRSTAGSSKVVVATSMHRISRTILKDYESSTNAHMDDNLFEQLSIMIADILGACLTNLPRVIVLKCYCSTIEEREKNVRHAASLLGETEEILGILRRHQLPNLSGDRAAYIDEWRAFMKQKNTPTIVGSYNNETAASGELHIAVDEQKV